MLADINALRRAIASRGHARVPRRTGSGEEHTDFQYGQVAKRERDMWRNTYTKAQYLFRQMVKTIFVQ